MTNQPAISSTLDANPPAFIDFLNRKQHGFCYFVVTNKEQQATNLTPLPEESPWASLWGFNIPPSQPLYADIHPANLLKGSSLDVPLCHFISSVWYTDADQVVFGYVAESADTHPLGPPQIIPAFGPFEQAVRTLLIFSNYEAFDTQTSYDLTHAFAELINRNGRPIIRALRVLINHQELNNRLICEALVSVGRLQNSDTESDRFELLIGLLDHHAPIVRDGAIMGLSFMDNKKAIPYLRKSLTKETVRTLRENIEVAIRDLETP